MALFRIHRMKETPQASFRWAAQTAGAAAVKPKDYELRGEVEADSAYGAWASLKDTEEALVVGDVLEGPDGALRIFKYVGFEAAQWVVVEQRAAEDRLAGVS